ncbi:MAG: hypothetical protein JWP74_431 [Marmoricola sp.]|nr:hypothetical protein [Marmoricola sp.]
MLALSPQARAIALITLAFLLVIGGLDRLGAAVVAVFGTDLTTRTHTQLILLVMILIGIAILLLARATSSATDGWAQAAAQAAQVLAVVGLATTTISLIASVLHNSPSGYYPYFAG